VCGLSADTHAGSVEILAFFATGRDVERRYQLAIAALTANVSRPVYHIAWLAISDWYQAKPRFEQFWEAASDRIGRLELYRQWRRGTR
jgi:hypothetical protein